MAGNVESNSDKLKAAGVATGKVRDLMDGYAEQIQTELDSLIAIISSDPVFGQKFTDDPKGLKYQLEGAVTGTRTMAKSWGELSEGQIKEAKKQKKLEDEREASFKRIFPT